MRNRFENNSALFTSAVVLSGGSYPALQFVSSNAFGLNKLSSGLTKYELRQMASIKIYSSVLLENCPQLIFQILYAYTTSIQEGGEVTNTVKFAFLASLLSVIASGLTYFINRDDEGVEMEAVQYHLAMECNQLPNVVQSGPGAEMYSTEIGVEQRAKVQRYRGLRQKLSRSLTRFWNSSVYKLYISMVLALSFQKTSHQVLY